MVVGVFTGTMVPAADNVAEVSNIGTELVRIHIQNTEGVLALDQIMKKRPAILTVVLVCK